MTIGLAGAWLRPARYSLLVVASVFYAACSGDGYQDASTAPTKAAIPVLPPFQQTPTVVRRNGTENEIHWVMEPGKIYSLHWLRSRLTTYGAERIDNVVSPFVHSVDDNDTAIYYALSAEGTAPGPAGYSAVFAQIDTHRRPLLALADINGDGCIEVLGTIGDCRGNFFASTDAELGLQSLETAGRNYRDARLVDLNGDRILDLVSNSYNQFLPGAPPAQLHIGLGGGLFRADPEFTKLGAAGYGETIVVADFDNDGDTDVYIPYYSYESPDEHSYLLINDGTGAFVDVADSVGVALRNIPAGLRPEGAQAIDFDFDGDLDLAVASKLFINRQVETGTMTFVEMSFPVEFDEGMQFIDWDNDGEFDVIKQYPYSDIGPQLFEYDGTNFTLRADAFPPAKYLFAYGLNSYDVNGDGRVDVLASTGRSQSDGVPRYPLLFINTPMGFRRNDYSGVEVIEGNDISAFADFDHSGTIDFVVRFATGRVFLNRARSTNVIRIRLLDVNGEENQFGRVVRISSEQDPAVILARAVDSGSGYLSNNQYQLLVSLPLAGTYTIEAIFRTGAVRVPNVSARQSVDIYEDGKVRILPVGPRR
jgi:hypothetical protein